MDFGDVIKKYQPKPPFLYIYIYIYIYIQINIKLKTTKISSNNIIKEVQLNRVQ
ncbi:MAG: hypothetical protein MCS20_01585 [Candidatus Phytoplasma mali]|nr:hypothetical protein [Candidatus Phytoplasma australiense]MBZ7920088.1 hypothetical protein [Candidatus Karelsulcia muelleri]MCG7202085.1 hypothetical protein [Candidatus Phytoplasma mali]